MKMLSVENLRVSVDSKSILEGVNIDIDVGDIDFLLGPNGSGKTSLAMAIIGHPKYRIEAGRILFYGHDITDLGIEKRVQLGITLTFQFAPEIKGITLRELANEIAGRYAASEDKVLEFAKILELEDLMDRQINVGFSGGERKRAEIFLTALQSPKFVIFDEPDSGVDPDSIVLIGKAITRMMDYGLKGALIITHTGFLSRYVNAKKAYVIMNGRIICYGPAKTLTSHILEFGFSMCEKRFRGEPYGFRLEGKI